MKKFDSKEFISSVKNLRGGIPHVKAHSSAKNVVYQVARDNGYDAQDVFSFLNATLSENYPDFMNNFNNLNWMSAYGHYIRKEDCLASKLQEILGMMEGKKNNEELKEWFFEAVKETGYNPEIMRIDMTIDLFGWMETLDLLTNLAEKETEVATTEKVLSAEDPSVHEKIRKTRTRTKYKEILQISMDGTLVRSWKNIAEICKANPEYKHTSISKCIRGDYRKAHDFVWKGVTEEMAAAA